MKQTLKIIAASALATAVVWKAAPALAEEAPQIIRVVRTADLDLASKSGIRLLENRLVIAAHEVCGTASDVDLVGKNKVRACRKAVLAGARAQGARLADADSSEVREILIAAR
ncbi:MAG: UrcA family protein [Sphingomicrobium sp.]